MSCLFVRTLILAVALLIAIAPDGPVWAEGGRLLQAKISGVTGRAVPGAKIFLYDSAAVRRPADFITPVSDTEGRVVIELPPGKYWGVARFKADGTYGPLLPGDKHSGEPLEIDMIGGNAEVEFVVADIMELGQKKRAAATDAIRLKGRVLDRQGQPLANAMVFAGRTSEYVELPEFVSAWTEGDGRYELFLPPGGSYRVGATLHYPLVKQEPPPIMLAVDSNKIDIAIDMDLTVK